MQGTDVPVPKFASPCGTLSGELRKSKGHWQLHDSSAVLYLTVLFRTGGSNRSHAGLDHRELTGTHGDHGAAHLRVGGRADSGPRPSAIGRRTGTASTR